MKVKLGRYQHYKGDVVEVLGKALHSETMEEFVVYKHVTGKRIGEPYYPRTSPAIAGRYGVPFVHDATSGLTSSSF